MEDKIIYKREIKVRSKETVHSNEGFDMKEFLKDIKSGLKDFLGELKKEKKQN